MKSKGKYIISLFAIAALLSNCGKSGFEPTAVKIFEPLFLYANSDGELRTISIDYSNQDTVFTISRFSNTGPFSGFYGQVNTDYYGAYDWSKFTPTDTIPYTAAVLHRYNRADPAYNKLYQRQFVFINVNQRIQLLQYFSDMNEQYTDLIQWNFPIVTATRSVSFINSKSFVVLYSDEWIYKNDTTKTRPSTVPYGYREAYLIRYHVGATAPELGEIITSFTTNDHRTNAGEKNKPLYGTYAQVLASANGEFFAVWEPRFNELGYTPYIIRNNGSMALNPGKIPYAWQDRYFGQSMFAMEMHPKKDSVFVIGDVNYRQVKVVELPEANDQRLVELRTKSTNGLIPGSNVATWSDFQRGRKFFMTYNNSGTKLAITHNLPNVEPAITIWDTKIDTLHTYKINRPGGNMNYNSMGKAGWSYTSKNQNLVYFFAGDTVGTDKYSLFYIDASKQSAYASFVNWDDVNFNGMAREELDFSSDIIGR